MPNGLAKLTAAVVMVAACGRTTERERIDFERMRIQQRGDLYSASAAFANGATMQNPPAGTLPRGSSGDTGVVVTGLTGGTAATTIPQPITSESLAVGAAKFRVYCGVCHGSAGFGGSTVAENMGPPRPPSLRSARVAAAPVGYIFTVATNGLGRMPSYAGSLTASERWDVVAYIRELQQMPAMAIDALDDSLRALAIQRIDSQAKASGRR